MQFDLHVGIDYSGRGTPETRTSALQVYAAFDDGLPRRISPPAGTGRAHRNWCRREIAEWLVEQSEKQITFIAGIDHGFSFPKTYFERYGIRDWSAFLDDFQTHWPTDQEGIRVDDIRKDLDRPPERQGESTDYRLAELWTSSAKSVFQFDVQGSVAKSTHAGLPWLRYIRHKSADHVHFWPFDGWTAETGRSVLAEVYPSIFRNRFARDDRTVDQQDAYSVAQWLSETDARGHLDSYMTPPLTDSEKSLATREGWILGIM